MDKIGDRIKNIEQEQGAEGVKEFSKVLMEWGGWFEEEFEEKEQRKGRIIYAGGDDFFGVIFNKDFPHKSQASVSGQEILDWLQTLPQQWLKDKPEHLQDLTFSLGFVWAAPGVPQRDILQHCREAQKEAKNKGRDRVAIRVVFSSGQYVQWVCPWDDLAILKGYEDLDGQGNWSHIYGDFAQLRSRGAFSLHFKTPEEQSNPKIEGQEIIKNRDALLAFMGIYFPEKQQQEVFQGKELQLFPTQNQGDRAWSMIQWLTDLINVGWYLCGKGEGVENNGRI